MLINLSHQTMSVSSSLKQAPRAWHSRLTSKLHELGFRPSQADTSLFLFRHGGVTVYVLIYADDIIIVSSSTAATTKSIQQLKDEFAANKGSWEATTTLCRGTKSHMYCNCGPQYNLKLFRKL